LNAPGQLVVSGSRAAIDRAAELGKAAGAKRFLPLNVGGPFHSVYMRPAAETLGKVVDTTAFSEAQVPVIANVDAEAIGQPDQLKSELKLQLYSSVRWIDTLQHMARLGCDRFLEIGPGAVQAGLVKRTLPGVQIVSFGAPAQREAALALLG
jgi:[acyl-carrier-protein] S-malonyltransferase